MDRRSRLPLTGVLLAAGLHGVLVVSGSYRRSFDLFTHLFFARHYRDRWWDLWEPGWYTGFNVASYPPLVHQLNALLARFVGLEAGWVLILLGVVSLLPVALYSFGCLFVGRRAAGYAAIGVALMPAVALTGHTFGQLPTLAGLLSALLALAAAGRFLLEGRARDAALAVALLGVVTASHHATLLFLPWAGAAVVVHLALNRGVRLGPLLRRSFVLAVLAAPVMYVVIWPFYDWASQQTMQTPIDHFSRHSFLRNAYAAHLFLGMMYGPLLLALPWLARQALTRHSLGPGVAWTGLFILGLGGTTPLPRWLFGDWWAWLTYDRFSLWASMFLLLFAGQFTVDLQARGGRLWRAWRMAMPATLAAWALAAGSLVWLPQLQTPAEDITPIAHYLAVDGRDEWRYITLGFGEQVGRLALLTKATTIDGSYHTARTLPELRQSGIGQIDAVLWSRSGLAALSPILERAPQHGVRWVFVRLAAHEPLLAAHGWVFVETLPGGARVWENAAAVKPAPSAARTARPSAAALSWGVLPLASLVAALTLAVHAHRRPMGRSMSAPVRSRDALTSSDLSSG